MSWTRYGTIMTDEPRWLCTVCYLAKPRSQFVAFSKCGHVFCHECAKVVLEMNIAASRTDLQCLKCSTPIPPHEVQAIVSSEHFQKYLDFSLRRYLASIPNVRHCPAPDCSYAYIFKQVSNCRSDRFTCERDDCGREFCYECKRLWHPGQNCEQAGAEVAISMPEGPMSEEALCKMNAKQCPVCHSSIEKMSDGSCNQVHCVCCGQDFCWLCGKRISEMHYLTPSGCPLYGRQRWSQTKTWCCRSSLCLFAPFLLLLIALIAIPVITVLIPIGVGYKVYTWCRGVGKACAIVTTVVMVILSLLLAPFLAILGALLVVPLGCVYVYMVIPVHLLRNANSQ